MEAKSWRKTIYDYIHLVDRIIQNDIEIGNFIYRYAYVTKVAEDNLEVSFGMNVEEEVTFYLINI